MSNYVNDMTNDKIWEMLKPKMEKNGLKKKMGVLYIGRNLVDGFWLYSPDDIHNAIAIAYRSGYERGLKGRPFKIGEKKDGHWEPVDPNNLPKEGTRVRYSRECIAYLFAKKPIIKIGDLGVVCIYNGWFGIKPEKPRNNYNWVSFDGKREASCLDMWVEDDE